jgi:CBS domain-containing protein
MSGFLDARPRVGYFYTGKTANQLVGEHIKSLTVGEYKSLPIVIAESTSVYDAICTMFLEDVGSIFIVKKEGYLTGVVSRKDLLKAAMGQTDLSSIPVGIIMSRMPNLVLCREDETLYDAAMQMVTHQVDSLPVVRPHPSDQREWEVVGRITKTSIVRAFVELGQSVHI